jgi:signal recognition particle receptor subunit beta
MSVINQSAREVYAKIVYYGPGLSGKTTSLKRIYESIRPTNRGEMVSLATEGDRTLFFDFLPVRVERVGDATVRLALYTVPGQVFYNATRKLVLQGADGVVFVADSQPAAMDNNIESMENLFDNLKEMGLDGIPVVIQYNKRDVPGVLPVAELRALLNKKGFPDFETVAQTGVGLLEALRAITRQVIRSLKEKGVVLAKPRKQQQVPVIERKDEQSLASQIEQAAATEPTPDPSLMSALVPEQLGGEAALAEADYRAGNYKEALTRSSTALRTLLSSLGPEGMSEVELALMAGLTGPDFARLLKMEKAARVGRDEAAFALLMLAMAGVRLRR